MVYCYTIAVILMVVFLTVGNAQEEQVNHVLSINGGRAIPQNPLSLILIQESSDITVQFGLSFLEEIRLLKRSCRSRANQLDRLFKNQMEQMSQYQQQTEEVLESSGMIDMSNEEKQTMLSNVRRAMRNLVIEQKNQAKDLMDNCTRQLEVMFNKKMYSALSYGRSILTTGGLGQYVTFVNHVTKYSNSLQKGLDDCIDVYSPLFTNYIDRTHYLGSTSEVCMTDEVETLIEFVRKFIIEATKLLTTYQTTVATPTSSSNNNIVTPSPIKEHSGSHRGHHGNHHNGHHHHNGAHHNGSHHGHGHNGSHHGHHGHNSHNGHHHGHNGNHHGHNGNHHGHNGNHHGHNGNHHGHNGHHHGHNGNHHGHHGHDGQGYNVTSRPSNEPLPTATVSGQIDIVVDPPFSKTSEHDGHMMTVLLICSIASALLVLAIIFVGVGLMIVRSKKKSRKEGWSNLTEEEKISQMKQSGYINPTYKFFDQVTKQ